MCYVAGPDGVARGEDALSILENPQSRNQFIDELMEVNMFPIFSISILTYIAILIITLLYY